ncbi:PepSY-associated TM helix domain-containing protein [Reyranella sp.]|uniref:PepSY-associated TM helix domain-containing protein n=1 Tax=Reyranella sp. TaxID=1929291 RepID=UPI003BA9CA09
MAGAAATARAATRINHRLAFVRWVRRTHGWFGLWGALLGLMAGVSGIWLNHRSILKIDLPGQRQGVERLAVPDPRPKTPSAMAEWLQQALNLDRPATNTRIERARPVPWGARGADGKPLMQPERWTIVLGGPNRVVQAEYWVGNDAASIRTMQNGFIATLTNLHKGTTMPVPWILLVDTLAGAMIFLSISGTILWWETHRRRGLGIAIFGVSVAATVALALWPVQW